MITYGSLSFGKLRAPAGQFVIQILHPEQGLLRVTFEGSNIASVKQQPNLNRGPKLEEISKLLLPIEPNPAASAACL